MLRKKGATQAQGVISFLVFATLVIIGVVVFSEFDTAATNIATTTLASQARGNVSASTFSAFQLVAVGPIIFGAVIILAIVGMLYKR